jgi:hypothetical protein
MKLTHAIAGLALSLAVVANAAEYERIFDSGFDNSGIILDGNLSGWSDMEALSGLSGHISDVSLQLSLSGGYSGDLYAYLSYNDVLIPLFNRIGVGSSSDFGSTASSLSITLSATGDDIHWATATGGAITGSYAQDGRLISPLSESSAFDAAGTISLASLTGLDPNGTWTLFIADVSGGGGNSVITSWVLDITTVPEPSCLALGALGAAVFAARRMRRSSRQ